MAQDAISGAKLNRCRHGASCPVPCGREWACPLRQPGAKTARVVTPSNPEFSPHSLVPPGLAPAAASGELVSDRFAANRAQLKTKRGKLIPTPSASRFMPRERIPQVSFCQRCGKRQRQALLDMIRHPDQKLQCECRPRVRSAGLTVEIISNQTRISFVDGIQ